MSFNNPFVSKGSDVKEGAKPTAGAGLDADKIESFLGEDDEEVDDDDKGEKKDKDKGKKEEKEELDIEDVDEDEDEDDENDKGKKLKIKDDEDDDEEKDEEDKKFKLSTPPRKAAIKAKYPDFFKDFPSIEKMIYRDREYNELFGSIEDARNLVVKGQDFEDFEQQLLSGDTSKILKTIKEADKSAYDKIIDGYLETLKSTDSEAYLDVTQNFAKSIIRGMVDEAKENDDKDLHKAAEALHVFLFNTKKWSDEKVRVKKESNDETKKITEERNSFIKERLNTEGKNLQKKVDNVLRSTISDHIDPKGSLTDYEKRKAIDECLDELHKTIGNDDSFSKTLGNLWKNAVNSKFSEESLSKIRKNYLSKSSFELNSIIKKIRAEVLKGKGSKGKKEEEKEEDKTPRDRKYSSGRPSQKAPKANERQKGESVEDFFMRD